uniref:Collagen alpha-1(XII) chain n=1 Tax=Magallana gigas TaxID=29159 RepID=K1PMT3_MAGGI
MVGGFQIGPNDVRMASVTFSSAVHDTFQFSEYNSVESLRNRVLKIPYDSGGTNTQLALQYARVTSFSYARSGVSKIAVVITDGKSNSKPKTLDEAEKLRNSGVIIFSVGVGSGVDRTELEGMASKSTYVFDVATFNALESIRERLTKTACEDIQPPVVHRCPSDIQEFSSLRFLNITWTGPNFTDPFHHDVDVTTNYPENGSTFFWGDYTAIYTALKQYNGLRSVCTFNISVRRRVRTSDDKIYSFRRCDDEEKDKMRGKYLDVLKKSSLRRLCNRYADLCKKENVDVQC